MTFNELTYSVWEILSGFNITDDSEFTVTLIEENMLSMNQTLVREAFNNKKITQSLYVMDAFVEVKKITEEIVVKGIPIKADGVFCYAGLNELVAGVGHKDIDYLGNSDLSRNYSRKSFRQLVTGDRGTLWALHTPSYAMNQNVAYMEAGKLSGTKYVTVFGLWNDPRKASGYDKTRDFPTPSEYKLQMLTIQHLLTGKNVPPDLISDAQRQVQPPRRQAQRQQPRREEAKEKR